MELAGVAAIFIDGGYVDKSYQHVQIDYLKLSEKIKERASVREILRNYYYHCLPYLNPNPNEIEQRRYNNADNFFKRIHSLPRFMVRKGKLMPRTVCCPHCEKEISNCPECQRNMRTYHQKGVDLKLGLDLTLLSLKGRISHALLVAGDSDFVPAIKIARNEGVFVHLFYAAKRPSFALLDEVDEKTFIDDFLNEIRYRPGRT